MYSRIIYTCIVLITLAAIITTLDAVVHLEILNQPLDQQVTENRRIKLSCRVSGLSNKFLVEWYKDKQVISSSRNIINTDNNKRFFVTGDSSKGQYDLRIQKAQRSDTGNYTCRIYRTLDRRFVVKSRTAIVQVVYLPDAYKFPECIRTQSESGIRENEMVPFCFSSVGAPPIYLDLVDDYGNVYQDGVHLDYSHRPSFVYLFVNVSRKLDGFFYRCRARSPYFKTYEVSCLLGPIKVIKKPLVYLEPLQSNIKIGDDVRYLCKGESDLPILEYKWEIHPKIKTNRVSYFDNNRVITLSQISKNDANTLISCSVKTEAGTTTAITELKLHTPEEMLSPLKITTTTTTGITEKTNLSVTERLYNEKNTQTTSHNNEQEVIFTEKNNNLSTLQNISLSTLKGSDTEIVFLALSALIIFQFLVILLACVFIRNRTKTGVKLPVQTEFQSTVSTPANPV